MISQPMISLLRDFPNIFLYRFNNFSFMAYFLFLRYFSFIFYTDSYKEYNEIICSAWFLP